MKNNNLPRGACALSLFLFIALFFGTLESAHAALIFEPPPNNNFFSFNSPPDDDSELDVHDLINRERRRRRLPDLVWDDRLADLARDYSRRMARENFFAHYDSNGRNIIARASFARIKNWSKIGENLFYCEGMSDYTAASVRGWMRSPAHKQNILDRDWTTTGIGIARARDGRIYVTQVFIKK